MKVSRALRTVLKVVVCLHLGIAKAGFAATDWSPSTLLTQPFNISVSKIQITPSARWGLFRESDSISIQTSDNSPIQIFDLDGNLVYSGVPTAFTFARGHYFVECNGDRSQFAVLPNDYNGASFLGTGADDGTDSLLTQRMASINPSWGRTGRGQWSTVEAQQGVWDWTAMDAAVAANAGRKLIAYAGDDLPTWVNPGNLVASYTQFVQALVSRYSNQLYALEVWNEPWLDKFPNTTNQDTFVALYLQLQSQARQVVKAINPSIPVIGPAWSSFEKGTSLAMSNSIDLFDGWSWHDYALGGNAPDQNYGPPSFIPSRQVGDLTNYFGNFVTRKPLLVDELGLYGQSALGLTNNTTNPSYRSNLDWYRGMCRAVKCVVMYRACGVEAIMPHVLALYTGVPNPNLEFYGWDQSGTNSNVGRGPHPKTSAYLMTGYWLNGATPIDYRIPGQKVFLYAWQLPNNASLVIGWALEGQTVPLQTNGFAQTTDIFGRTNNVTALAEEPVLFHSNSLDPLTLLNAIRSNLVGITNTAPVIDPLPTESVVAEQPLQITVSATDAERDPITYSATVLPPGATFDPATRTFSWTPGAGASGPYTATFVATDSLGASNSITTTITVLGTLFDGLSSHWEFDESTGTIAADSVGSNNGTLTGFNFTANSGWVSGIISNALSFDGVNDSVSLDSNQINLTNNFTISLWLKPQNASGVGAFFSVRSSYEASGLRFFVAGNSLMLQGETTAGWQNIIPANNPIQNGIWYHVAVVYDNSNLSVYLNGVLQGSTNWGGDLVANPVNPSRIGTEGSYYFKGAIDDMMIFERTLTAAQVLAIYQSADQPPVFAPLSSQYVPSGQSINFTLAASDPNNTNLTYAATSLPSGASFNTATGAFSWTPSVSQTGTFNITFSVTDGLLTNSESTVITVSSGVTPAIMQITSSPMVTNPIIQISNLAVVVAGETNTFNVTATDLNNNTLYYAWTFGDGDSRARLTNSTSSHVYTNCGPYIATVNVDDGTYSTNASFTVTIACQLNVSQLQGTLNFAKTNADSCTIKGTFALPSNYNFGGKLMTLNIGGTQTSFTLDSAGRSLNGLNRVNKPSYNKATALWTFNVTLRNGSWQTDWAALGLVNANIPKPGASVTLPVILVISDESFMAIPQLQYTAKVGKSGAAK